MEGGVLLRGRIWWIAYRHAGKTIFESSKSIRREDAVALRETKHVASRAGTLRLDAARLTWEDLKRIYAEAAVEKGNRSRPTWTRLDETFAGMRALDIAARCHGYFADRLRDGYAIATVNQDKAALRRMFRLARERGLISHDQVPAIQTPNPHNERQWFLTDKQVNAIWDELPAHMQGVWAFCRLTGWRGRSDVLPLLWSNVDWKAGVVRIVSRKTGKPIEFPFEGYAPLKAVLVAQKKLTHGPYVFHDAKGEQLTYERWNKARKRACRAAGVDPKRAWTHDLRRTASMAATRAGVPMKTVMDLMGHRTTAMFLRYGIKDAEAAKEAVVKLSAALDNGDKSW
jgi:integrase